MSTPSVIPVYVPPTSSFEVKGMTPNNKLKQLASSSAEVSVSVLQTNLNQVLAALLHTLDQCTTVSEKFQVDEVTVELGIDSTGKASIWPFSAELAAGASLQVKLGRRTGR